MPQRVAVAKLVDLKNDEGTAVEVKGRLIALFLHASQVYAIDDSCPHMGGPLSEGEACDTVVRCPWHGWRFRLDSGLWADAPKSGNKTAVYATEVDDGNVYLVIDW